MLPLPLIEWQFVAKMESWATTGQFTQMFFLCFNLSFKNVGEGITILIPIIICYIGQKQTNSYKNNNVFHLSYLSRQSPPLKISRWFQMLVLCFCKIVIEQITSFAPNNSTFCNFWGTGYTCNWWKEKGYKALDPVGWQPGHICGENWS